ncbi:FAD:protein FMN transferase [Aquibacillus rhizosphaerae]|uniref:FAD:protein FMN transferase n=1 Tax=Aquibacillus rhizosphaerae TaxID=3051431 RepID=A0ABT7L7B2_9BACI|nr:FAD:protein FMN transferase [Aquibacillus sp. LR5S19]MDL4840490.1 FAD:protein FMN transferase [Aquibacillus sp. LR5S19]
MKKKRLIWIWCVVGILLVSGCGNTLQGKEEKVLKTPFKETAFLMGTVVTVKIYDKEKESVLKPVFKRIHDLANQINAEESESEIDKVNEKAGVEPVEVSSDIYNLVKAGKQHSTKSNGSFDITIGPLTSLWHIGYEDARKPEQSEIDDVLPLIDYEKVELIDQEQTVFLKEKGMRLDLGAIAKGFIADEVVEVLKENGVTTAIIDLGGNIYVMGNNPSGEAWNVGIQDPFSARGEIVGKVRQSNRSVVTSGIYERFLEVDGIKYHHLLNPGDGYPFMNDLAGVSIISEQSIDGDALSTTVFSKGLVDGLEYLENISGVEAIFISTDKKVYTTSGLQDFELTNEAFEMGE